MINISFVWLFVFAFVINAQQFSEEKLDSLYTKFIRLRAPELLSDTDQMQQLTIEDKKCGFRLAGQIRANIESFTIDQQNVLRSMLQRPDLQKSIVTPSGFFRVHYDTSGVSIPSFNTAMTIDENVNEVVNTLDSVYNFEIGFLNYPPPPPDNGSGGDDKYDVYIINQGGGFYGYTEWESKVGSNNWSSFLVIDNDYTGYFSQGIDGMKVTIAHEFHHGIQLGSYGIENSSAPFRDDDVFFYEITSTSMEEFVYDEINDYYQYLDSYFRRTDRAFPLQNGYNLAIWNLFLTERFGFDILKEQWELIPAQSAVFAVRNSLNNYSTTFQSELNEFGIWTYYTNYRSVPGLYFEEAANYPVVAPNGSIQFTPPSQQVDMNSAPLANNFLRFYAITSGDTLFAIVTNGDAAAAASNPNQFFPFQYTLFSDGETGERKLTEDYSSDFSATNGQLWSVSEILNNVIVRTDSMTRPSPGSIFYPYPNPFNYGKNYITGQFIFFPVNANTGETSDFNVYTSGMQLVYNSEKNIRILPGDQQGVSWNGIDKDGNKLASGVYIYVIETGDDVETGKVVIFNE